MRLTDTTVVVNNKVANKNRIGCTLTRNSFVKLSVVKPMGATYLYAAYMYMHLPRRHIYIRPARHVAEREAVGVHMTKRS